MTNKEDKNTPDSNSSAAGSGDQNNKSTKNQPASTGSSGENDSTGGPVQNVLAQAKDSVGEVYGLVADKASSEIEGHKKDLSGGLVAIADSIRQAGQTLRDGDETTPITDLTAKYGETIADQIEQVSNYFDKKDLRGIARDVENFARRQPVIFIGAAFAAGLLAARFLKSSAGPISQPGSNPEGENAGTKMPKPSTRTGNQAALNAA
jgi:hypothetical protein